MSTRRKETSRSATLTALLSAAVVALLAFAAPALAEVRGGSATDPDESSPGTGERIEPWQDILAVDASYDTPTGTLTTVVATAAPPKASATNMHLLAIYSPLDGNGGCPANALEEPFALVDSSYGEPSTAEWLYDYSTGSGQKAVSGNVTTLTASDPALANRPLGCVQAIATEIDSEGEFVGEGEALAAPIVLRGPGWPPAPATQTPPPASSPPPSAPPPAPTPKLAKLRLAPKPLTLRRRHWKKVKLRVANAGDATAARVKLTLGKARGVAIKPKSRKLELRSIAPRKSKVVAFKLLLTRKAKPVSKIAIRVRGANGVKANGKLVLKAWKKKRRKKPAKPTKPGTNRGSLAGKIFYSYDSTDTTHSAYLEGYAFIDDTWAYNDIPSGGLPHCTEVTGTAKEAGCVKYSYEPKTGAVQLGSVTGARITKDGNFEIDGEAYLPLWVPPAGARYQVDQYFIGFNGLCGMITGCSTWHEYVTLTSGGEFVYTHESLTTIGGSGPGETFIAAGSYPPDEHGTYTVEKGARIKLAFADGHTETKTFAIFLDKAGKPDPVNAGFIFDTTYFTFAGTD